MRIFKIKSFSKWADQKQIEDKTLITAIDEITKGLFEVNLGSYIYKKRVKLGSKGKRGGARTIVAFKTKDKAIFIYGFSKGKKSNITKKEEDALKALATAYFNLNDKQISIAIKAGELTEVQNEKNNSRSST